VSLPDGSNMLRLRRTDLAPGESLPETPVGLRFGVLADTTDSAAVSGFGSAPDTNTGTGPITLFIATLEPAPDDVAATPAPDAMALSETLLEVQIPAEAMPYGNTVMGGLNHQTIPASVTASWGPESGACCPGVRVDYVLSGTYTMRSNMAGWVVRAGESNLDGVVAGADLVLGPGDASIFQNEATITYANGGPDPVEMLFWIVFDGVNGGYSTDPTPAGAEMHDSDIRFALPSVPFGPALVRLRLVELAPEERLAPPDGAVQFAVTLPPSMPGTAVAANRIATESDGSAVNLGSAAGLVYVLTWDPESQPSTPSS
jgi:hypothetical protein